MSTGTGNPPYNTTPTVESLVQDGRTTKVTHQLTCITAMPQYEGKSQEELRLEDYQRNNKGRVTLHFLIKYVEYSMLLFI